MKMKMYPYEDMPEYACRNIENKNRTIKNMTFGLDELVIEENFFNCSFIGCTFLTDKIISSMYINCHFQDCIFTTSNKLKTGDKLPFSNTIYASCSFLKCCFNEHMGCYETMNRCIFEKTTLKDSVLNGYHLVDVHFKNCVIRNLSLQHSTMPLILMKDCNIDEMDLAETKIGCISFAGGSQKNIVWDNASVLSLEHDDTEGDFNNIKIKSDSSIPDFTFRSSEKKW